MSLWSAAAVSLCACILRPNMAYTADKSRVNLVLIFRGLFEQQPGYVVKVDEQQVYDTRPESPVGVSACRVTTDGNQNCPEIRVFRRDGKMKVFLSDKRETLVLKSDGGSHFVLYGQLRRNTGAFALKYENGFCVTLGT